MIYLTDAAWAHFKPLISMFKARGIRLEVKSFGCSGLTVECNYAYDITDHDAVFHRAPDGKYTEDRISIYVNKQQLQHVKGTTIDLVTNGINQVIIFRNPNVTSECGCGQSFSTKQ